MGPRLCYRFRRSLSPQQWIWFSMPLRTPPAPRSTQADAFSVEVYTPGPILVWGFLDNYKYRKTPNPILIIKASISAEHVSPTLLAFISRTGRDCTSELFQSWSHVPRSHQKADTKSPKTQHEVEQSDLFVIKPLLEILVRNASVDEASPSFGAQWGLGGGFWSGPWLLRRG